MSSPVKISFLLHTGYDANHSSWYAVLCGVGEPGTEVDYDVGKSRDACWNAFVRSDQYVYTLLFKQGF